MKGVRPGGVVVGRDDVLAGLEDLLTGAQAGRGTVAVLIGDPGIGKTRLADEVVSRARHVGLRVAVGHCDELDQTVPLVPLVEVLGSPVDGDAVGEGAHVRAAARALETLADDGPALVVVEDLHWCDEASLAALARLSRRLATLPLLLVLTLRPARTNLALTSLLAALGRLSHVKEWTLRPFDIADTGRLISEVLGSGRPPSRAFLERVQLITEGNPLFVKELCAALDLDEGGDFPDPAAVDRLPVPRSVQAAVWQRSRRLSEDGRRLLQLAAVAGRSVDVDLLAEVAGWDEADLLAHLREVVASGLLVDESADRVAFSHELTRRAVVADVLARERRAMHLAVARAMERRLGGDLASAGPLAHHFAQAEAWPEVEANAGRAGHHALAEGAPRAAAELFTLAIEAAGRGGRPPDTATLAGRGAASEVLGQFALARADLDEVLARARQGQDATAECAALLELGRLWSGRDYGRAGDYYRRALALARDRGTRDVLAQALNRTGSWHLNSDRPQQAERLHQEARAIYRKTGDLAGEAATLDLLGTVHLTTGDLGEAASCYGDAVVRFRAIGDRTALASALTMQAFCARQYLGGPASWSDCVPFEEAVADGSEAVELCRALEWTSGEALGHIALASVFGQQGVYGPALDHESAARRLAAESGNPYWAVLADVIGGALHLDLLEAAPARQRLAAAFDAAGELGSAYWQRTACGFLVKACLLAGDATAATAAVGAVRAIGGSSGAAATMGQRHLLQAQVEVALAAGDHTLALHAIEELAAAIAPNGPPGPAFLLLRGHALAAAGLIEEAEHAWRDGLTEATGANVGPLAWRLHAALGRSLRAHRHLDEADEHLAAARRQIEALADGLAVAGAERASGFRANALAGVPATTRRREAKLAFGGLTAREREIAVLVAGGLTNAQIADRLFLSPRTVEKHIEHTLTKLALGSRAQIAVWAVRSGLEPEAERTW